MSISIQKSTLFNLQIQLLYFVCLSIKKSPRLHNNFVILTIHKLQLTERDSWTQAAQMIRNSVC